MPAARRDPGRRAGRRGARPVLRGVRAGRGAPAPGSAGSRAGPASAARWTPAPCPPCCPAAARSPTPRPGPRWSRPGAWRPGALPAAPGPGHRRASSTRRPPAGWPRWWSAGSTRTTWPTRRPRWPRCAGSGFLVSLELQHSRGHRAGRRGAPGGPGRPARRQLPQLGGPAPRVRPALDASRGAAGLPGAGHAGRRDGRRPVHPDPGRGRRRAARLGSGGRAGRPAAAGGRRPSRCARTTGRRCWPPGAS